MPRPPRLHIPGGCYHVIMRGNHREDLFEYPADRQRLNDIVGDILPRTGARVHAFCWMTNHLHALVQVSDQPLGKTMHRIAVRYSRYRHRSLGTTGHLFERRYKAKLVDVDEYFLILLRYIHLNPVKAHIVSNPADYPWSSHQAYLGRITLPWLTTDFALSMFSHDLARARLAYSKFISESVKDDELENEAHPKDSRVLGSDRFVENLPFIPYKPRSPLTLEQLAKRVCEQHSIATSALCSLSRARRLTPIRIQFATQAVDLRIATLAEVARFLHRDPSALTKLLSRHPYSRGTQS
jgi:putative transposase